MENVETVDCGLWKPKMKTPKIIYGNSQKAPVLACQTSQPTSTPAQVSHLITTARKKSVSLQAKRHDCWLNYLYSLKSQAASALARLSTQLGQKALVLAITIIVCTKAIVVRLTLFPFRNLNTIRSMCRTYQIWNKFWKEPLNSLIFFPSRCSRLELE